MEESEFTEEEVRKVILSTYHIPSPPACTQALLYNDQDEIARLRLIHTTIKAQVEAQVAAYMAADKEGRVALLGSITQTIIEPTEAEVTQEKTRLQEAENAKIDARIAANRP